MKDLTQLFRGARSCQRCYPEHEICVPLPDPKNSVGRAEIVFVNERPGRIGTGLSGYVSFDNDDPSASFFRECFELAGLDRRSVFITNSCLCYPLLDGYVDTKPRVFEMEQCQFWMHQQIEIANPKLIVTIGRTAWESILRYTDQWQHLKGVGFLNSVGRVIAVTTPWVYPLSHTSMRGRISRSADEQKEDWKRIPQILRELENHA